MSVIETIAHERDFKVLCDGLLRFELGQLVQTFASHGKDAGIDAQFDGPIDGRAGRWVFQYKFRSPATATTAARAWLKAQYAGSKTKRSEFDKEGVCGADGYILLTNIPVTVALVRHLAQAWHRRQPNASICVWDPSRLNALLKGRGHLARSWNGAKEARCRQAVVLPLWQWLQGQIPLTGSWDDDPLWPIEVESYQTKYPVAEFHNSFEWRYGLKLIQRDRPLHDAVADPQFEYASSVAYPRAMEPFKEVCHAIDALVATILGELIKLDDELAYRAPDLQQINEPERSEVRRILAYCILESRWGFPMRGLHRMDGGRLIARAKYIAWEKPTLNDLEPILNLLVGEAARGEVPSHVVAARERVSSNLQEWWSRLWYVVELGIDAE